MTEASVAQEQPARHERQRIGQPAQDAELARHVVGAGGQLAQWRAAQHRGLAIELDQVIEVRQSAGELPWRRLVIETPAMCSQMRAHGAPVEWHTLLGRAHISRALFHPASRQVIQREVESQPVLRQPNG